MRRLILQTSAVFAIAAMGCESQPSEPSMEQRQADALKDPFSYGPDVPSAGGRKTAPVAEPQKRDDSFKGEWNRFWNP
jgi:hypothetical protein